MRQTAEPWSRSAEPRALEPLLRNEQGPRGGKPAHPCSPQVEKSCVAVKTQHSQKWKQIKLFFFKKNALSDIESKYFLPFCDLSVFS